MIDVLRLPARRAVLSGNCVMRNGEIRLNGRRTMGRSSRFRNDIGTTGTATFGTFTPSARPVWISAELEGVFDQRSGSVRVRIGTDSALWYLDEDDNLTLKPVTDETSWDSEYCTPLALCSLDLWPEPTVRIVVGMISTVGDQNPVIRGVSVLANFPTWEGCVAQMVRLVAGCVASIRPVLLHDEVVTAPKSEWLLGAPLVETGHVITSVESVDVDGSVRTSQLQNGRIVIDGAPAKPGQRVRIAVRYQPQTVVRRVADVRVIHQLPAFIIDDLVRGGGMNGLLPTVTVGGVEVRRVMVHLKIQVKGAATRQADALAMRASLHEKFGTPEYALLDSGRSIGIGTMDLVEVYGSGIESMPCAVGTVQCPFEEFTSFTRVGASRRVSDDGVVTTPTNTVTISHTDTGVDQVIDESSFTC